LRIPPEITRDVIIEIVKSIDRGELQVPKKRWGKRYEVVVGDKKYPPKFLIDVAHRKLYVTKLEGLMGGSRVNNFLRRRGFLVQNFLGIVDLPSEDIAEQYWEGSKSYRLHRKIERNSKLVQAAKFQRLRRDGDLCCEVCGFSFGKTYGSLGDKYIEAHHKIPICKLKKRTVTRIEDLALVCSNCHRMLHYGDDVLGVEELRSMINRRTRAARL
jgi:hypothetical protein